MRGDLLDVFLGQLIPIEVADPFLQFEQVAIELPQMGLRVFFEPTFISRGQWQAHLSRILRCIASPRNDDRLGQLPSVAIARPVGDERAEVGE